MNTVPSTSRSAQFPVLRWRVVALLLATAFGIFGSASARAQDVITEPERQTPVLHEVDVVVIGGGLSGVGAALGAARSGAKTLVIERTGYLGGWLRGTGLGATLGIRGWRPSLGEGVLRDIAQRTVDYKMEFHPDLETVLQRGNLEVVNHEIMSRVFQSLITEAGGEIQYFSTYAGSIVKDGRIEAVLIETPVGRYAVRGKVFIDCTGLATVAAESDAPTKKAPALMGLNAIITGIDHDRHVAYEKAAYEKGANPDLKPWLEGKLGYPITSFSSDGGPDSMPFPWDDWVSHEGALYGEQFREAVEKGEMPLFLRVGEHGIVGIVEGIRYKKNDTTGAFAWPRTYVTGVDPTDPRQLSEAHEKSVEFMFKFVEFLNKYIPGFERAQITRFGEMTLNRAGRSLVGYMPTSEELNPPVDTVVSHDDAIVVVQRGAKAGLYEVPYSAMLTDKLDNLLAVGKSSSGGIRFRTHNITVIMGQAAGTAAAIAVQDGQSPRNVDIRKVQAALRTAGIAIPEKPAKQP